MLPLAVLALFITRLRDLFDAYRVYPVAIAARAATWQSGLQPGAARMTMQLAPAQGLITNGDYLARGRYTLAPDSPWYIRHPTLLQ